MSVAAPLGFAPPHAAATSPRRTARVIVTTVKRATSEHVARGRVVAARCGVPFVTRVACLADLAREHGAELAYVVGSAEEWLAEPGGARLHVHRGLLDARCQVGRSHPLLRAVAPPAERPVARILDATLGLAQDALHLADMLDADVLGVEASPVLVSLVEAGLHRMARDGVSAAARVHLVGDDVVSVLTALPDDAVDVVFVDPMFARPRPAAPGFQLLRRVAEHTPFDERFWAEARRVAARRVVVKLARKAPGNAALGFDARVIGKALEYGILDSGSGSGPGRGVGAAPGP